MTHSNPFLTRLLSASTLREADQDMFAWFNRHKMQIQSVESTIEKAMLGGRTSENVAYAFAAGYQSAIECLFEFDGASLGSLCVTEAQGNHPRAIKTQLTAMNDGYVLNGQKNFVSGGLEAGFLYVACKVGEFEDGRPRLKVVGIPADSKGVSIKALPTLPFIPEVSHGAVTFEDVLVSESQVLPGDGYLDYVKPFRTVEDLHVVSAVLAYRLGEAIQSGWKTSSIEAHLPLLSALRALVEMSFDDPGMHLAFAACREQISGLITETDTEFSQLNPQGHEFWVRDKKLLSVAEKAHQTRTAQARETLGFSAEVN